MPRESQSSEKTNNEPTSSTNNMSPNGAYPSSLSEEARRALEQYDAYEAMLVGPTPQWELPQPDPNIVQSQ